MSDTAAGFFWGVVATIIVVVVISFFHEMGRQDGLKEAEEKCKDKAATPESEKETKKIDILA